MVYYAKNPQTNRIEQKDLIGLVDFLSMSASDEVLEIFSTGIPNEYHSGSQLEPVSNKKNAGILQEAFIAQSVIKDFEEGFLLGLFPSGTQYISWHDSKTNQLKVQHV